MDGGALRGKKFIASYSGGKDSLMAVYRAAGAGLEPAGLITTYNTDAGRSWFHGVNESMFREASESLGLPVTLIKTSGEAYAANFEKALAEARLNGAEVCVFGDIDIDGHFEWCSARCGNAGLIPYFPLKGESRKNAVYGFIDAGFSAVITIVDTERLPEKFLGRVLTREIADEIEAAGADICGENGEYHTFAYDGPLFSRPVRFAAAGVEKRDKYAFLKIESPTF